MKNKSYHDLSTANTLESLGTSTKGLSSAEAGLRSKKFGLNNLPQEKKLSATWLFFQQFNNPLIYVLLFALILSFATAHFVDGWIVLVVILVSGVVGFLQEYKADKALAHLSEMVKYKTRVVRNGEEVVVDQEKIVPGDIIVLSPGDKIPADSRLLEAQNLEIIEAALTGESFPSKKSTTILSQNTSLADRKNMVFMGTVVARGKAKAVVVATGIHTELGHVANLVKEVKSGQTPLQKQLADFGKTMGLILVGVNILIFGIGILTGKPLFEMLMTSVAVVVSAVPEGLLPAMTVVLAIGTQKLAKRKGLVRKMVAAETLGSVSVICTDKTGTITKGEMRVAEIITEKTKVSHDGDSFSSTIQPDGEASHVIALKIGLLCNNAIIENPEDNLSEWTIVGDATEKALLLAARSAGLKKEMWEDDEPRIAEVPFDSEYKFMATLHEQKKGCALYAKGAPEKILSLSSHVDVEGIKTKLSNDKKNKILKQHQHLTSKGLRVLAVAYQLEDDPVESSKFSRDKVNNLVFVGLIALKDPIRPEIKRTIAQCVRAGIKPIVITGDHKLTTMAIVAEAGIKVSADSVIEGSELDEITDKELQDVVKNVTIFARVEPKHKIRIITAFQANGEVVAMVGDGVNDSPAIKKADIGVAVGSGTDVAKETADLVLMDSNFKTIVEAIKRGRIVFNNIRKVVLYLVTDAFSEMIIVGSSVVLGLPLPILPVQILWIKLIEDAAPAISLSFDEIEEDVMNEAPRKKNEPILNTEMKKLIAFYSIIMDVTLFGLFFYYWKTSGDLDYARTITFVGLGLASLFYIYSVRGLKLSILQINPFSNKLFASATVAGILLFLVALYVPFFNKILHTVPLGVNEWLVLGGYALMSIVVYEVGKKLTIARTRTSSSH
ncbi:MAG: HAD-IC family P-type ATPase [Candidatus Pacebacteria bacterium]|nr:HAD-IC family P-type ATPase [Candidatus Paceibacterota bacterium]MBT3511653.1 HAD-IC family P-type ATPase [Candidatus Paceibacterota bacterium]MBT4004498.1 HAD-IC family P-type ATPase [Candidatus Paceibacterota bacterium]MBT4358830.1 HAD-IC family P-type ATPase [Candidatus Paceibacterota bacterium]MBT4680654.1 HAD-IC family P-type ATPase [Candidatus Paceibacterota bacterium]